MSESSEGTPDSPLEPFAGGLVLTSVVGDTPRSRLLAVLLAERRHAVGLPALAYLSGLDESIAENGLDALRDANLVDELDEDDSEGAQYQLDTENRAVRQLAAFERAIVADDAVTTPP